jgi:hypothetical protein
MQYSAAAMTELGRVTVVSWLLVSGCQGVKPPVKASGQEERPVAEAKAEIEAVARGESAVPVVEAAPEPVEVPAEVPSGKAELGPGALDAGQRAQLLAGDEERIFSKREHFTVSNEYRHDLWFPYLRGLGGVYVGVASDQNYTLMAVAGSEIGYLIDLDRQVVHLHRVYMALIAASEDPDMFLQRFGEPAAVRAETKALLVAGLSDMSERDRAAALAFVDENRAALREYLQAVRNTKRGEQGVTWLADPTLYQYMRGMVAGGRLRAINGNLAGKKAMATIAAGARALGQDVKLLYLSNAEEYPYYTPDFVANVRALPAAPGSVVLRTIHDRFEGWESCGDGDRRWNYQVQPLVDFQARLGDRKNTARTAMLARANEEKVIDRVARGVSVFKSPP